jgi:dihydroorotate dehydrogenase electron transfer subunit
MNIPKTTEIIQVKDEAKNLKTLFFSYSYNVKPGQFVMVWIPNVDEIPMSISYQNDSIKGITFRAVGDATSKLYQLKEGDKIGIRGPYGNGFNIIGNHILFVGGGTGIASLGLAIEEAVKNKILTNVILGAKTKNELFFETRLKKYCKNILVSTDDGSKGKKGFASDLAYDVLKKGTIDTLITCGPELMMKKLLSYCNNIDFQASLERYMKCSIGLCGQCCIGDGLRVCIEGPVFDGKTLKNIRDFGIYRRDRAGKKILF